MKQGLPIDSAGKTITCLSCQALNRQANTFCHQCGSPIRTTATLDPLQTIQTEGFMFRKALEGKPRPIVLVGVWILFFPVLVCSIGVALYLILNPRRFSDFVFFWALVGLSYIAFVFLYRITRNYLTIRTSDVAAEIKE